MMVESTSVKMESFDSEIDFLNFNNLFETNEFDISLEDFDLANRIHICGNNQCQLEFVNLQADYEVLKAQKNLLISCRDSYEKSVLAEEKLRTTNRMLRAKIETLTEEKLHDHETIKSLANDINRLEHREQMHNNEKAHKDSKIAELQLQVESLTNEKINAESCINQLKHEMDDLKDRISKLAAENDQNEAYLDSHKCVLDILQRLNDRNDGELAKFKEFQVTYTATDNSFHGIPDFLLQLLYSLKENLNSVRLESTKEISKLREKLAKSEELARRHENELDELRTLYTQLEKDHRLLEQINIHISESKKNLSEQLKQYNALKTVLFERIVENFDSNLECLMANLKKLVEFYDGLSKNKRIDDIPLFSEVEKRQKPNSNVLTEHYWETKTKELSDYKIKLRHLMQLVFFVHNT